MKLQNSMMKKDQNYHARKKNMYGIETKEIDLD